MASPLNLNYSLPPRTLFHSKEQRPLAEADFCDWQIPYSLASCSRNGVAERRNKPREPRFANTGWRNNPIDRVYVPLLRSLINSRSVIILKIPWGAYPLR